MLPDWNDVRDIEAFLKRNYLHIITYYDHLNGGLCIRLKPNPRSDARSLVITIGWDFFAMNNLNCGEVERMLHENKMKVCAEIIHQIYKGEKIKAGARKMGAAAAKSKEEFFREIYDEPRETFRGHGPQPSGENVSERATGVSDQAALEQ